MSNFFFNNFKNSMEQDLIESLVVESISIFGHESYYITRTTDNKDDIYGESSLSSYNNAYLIDLYIRSYDNYEGDGTFLSKFGLEVRDQITFTISRKMFSREIASYENIIRPREGDLIYSKMMKRLFIVKYVNQTSVFYQMGELQTWDIVCDTFEWSNETINTGIDEIDQIAKDYSFVEEQNQLLTNDNYAITTNDGYQILDNTIDFENALEDVFADNEEILQEEEEKDIIEWDSLNPFSERVR